MIYKRGGFDKKPKHFYEIRIPNCYVDGIIGSDTFLNIFQRIKILFSRGLAIYIIGKDIQIPESKSIDQAIYEERYGENK